MTHPEDVRRAGGADTARLACPTVSRMDPERLSALLPDGLRWRPRYVQATRLLEEHVMRKLGLGPLSWPMDVNAGSIAGMTGEALQSLALHLGVLRRAQQLRRLLDGALVRAYRDSLGEPLWTFALFYAPLLAPSDIGPNMMLPPPAQARPELVCEGAAGLNGYLAGVDPRLWMAVSLRLPVDLLGSVATAPSWHPDSRVLQRVLCFMGDRH